MLTAFVFAVLMGSFAQAKSDCYQLLRFDGHGSAPVTADPIAAARWVNLRMGDKAPVSFSHFLSEQGSNLIQMKDDERTHWLGRFGLRLWKRWSDVNETQREAALAAELARLRPERPSVVAFRGSDELRALSAANLQRLLARLEERRPLFSAPTAQVEKTVGNLLVDFHNLRDAADALSEGANAPLVSDHEVQRAGLEQPGFDFYTVLTGNSLSIPFRLEVTAAPLRAVMLGRQLQQNAVRLKNEFATAFYLPNLGSAVDTVAFFADWDPEGLDLLFRSLRLQLPAQIDTPEKFVKYARWPEADNLFPDAEAFQRLGVLRQRLHRFVLTRADGETFLRAAFRRFWLDQSQAPMRFIELLNEWNEPLGPQMIWRTQFHDYLGMPALTLRVPVSVPSTGYTLVRREALKQSRVDYSDYPLEPPVLPNQRNTPQLDRNVDP